MKTSCDINMFVSTIVLLFVIFPFGSSKVDYHAAVSEFPELTRHLVAGGAQSCSDYDRNKIRMIFYSRSKPHGSETMEYSHTDDTTPIKIIMQQTHDGEHVFIDLVTAYLRHPHLQPVNVICVHYPTFFGCDFDQYMNISDHITKTISQLITRLHANGTSLDRVHIIGLGLSAHLAGGVAKMLKPLKIGRITGLDPLGGAFDRSTLLGRLDAKDADFVDVISTNTRKFGTKKMRGTVQFYPSGGEIQPETDDFVSHLKAKDYFLESIVRTNAFTSVNVSSWTEFKNGVRSQITAHMGEYVCKDYKYMACALRYPDRAHNKFFLDVNSKPPFSKV